jgi:hypothetical protein
LPFTDVRPLPPTLGREAFGGDAHSFIDVCVGIGGAKAVLPRAGEHEAYAIIGIVSVVIAGDDERRAAALPLLSQDGFGDRVRSSQSYGTGA